jgi:cell division protein FtsW (lipid II flippase)
MDFIIKNFVFFYLIMSFLILLVVGVTLLSLFVLYAASVENKIIKLNSRYLFYKRIVLFTIYFIILFSIFSLIRLTILYFTIFS